MSKGNNDKKRNRILFDFESIVDLKLSIIKQNIFKKTGYPVRDFELNHYKWYRMFSTIDITNTINYHADDYFHPKFPVFTSMKSFIERLHKEGPGLFDAVVLCKDEIQQRIIKETFPNVKTLVSSRDNVKTLNFARIVLANPKHALEFKDPVTVDFLILNFRENFIESDDKLIDPSIISAIGDINTFTVAKAYPEIPDPIG